MMAAKPDSIPRWHATFLEQALPRLQADSRIVGVAAAGSFASDSMDEFSDLDLVIALEPEATEAAMGERHAIAAQLGPLVAAFTGEHVGEPRLLICLYGGKEMAVPIHVDLKFVALPDAVDRVDEPVVIWEREGRLSRVLQQGEARYPAPDLQWIEDRFWVWIHYAAVKIGRGELFEAMDFLAFLRFQVFGPLVLLEAGAQPSGVRRVESAAPHRAEALQTTIARYERKSCICSLNAAADLYRSLRGAIGAGAVVANEAAEKVAMEYLANVSKR